MGLKQTIAAILKKLAGGDDVPEDERLDLDAATTQLTEAVETHVKEETKGLVRKKEELLKKRKELDDGLKELLIELGVDDLEEAKERIQTLEDIESRDAGIGGDDGESFDEKLEKRLEVEKRRWQKEADKELRKVEKDRDELKEQFETERAFTEDLVLEKGLTERLSAANVKPTLIPAAKALLKQTKHEIKVEDDGTRVAVFFDEDDLEYDLDTYVGNWTDTEVAKEFIQADATGGGGGGGKKDSAVGGDANPFKSGNRTEQGKILREDVNKARRLAKEAGWTESKIDRIVSFHEQLG